MGGDIALEVDAGLQLEPLQLDNNCENIALHSLTALTQWQEL